MNNYYVFENLQIKGKKLFAQWNSRLNTDTYEIVLFDDAQLYEEIEVEIDGEEIRMILKKEGQVAALKKLNREQYLKLLSELRQLELYKKRLEEDPKGQRDHELDKRLAGTEKMKSFLEDWFLLNHQAIPEPESKSISQIDQDRDLDKFKMECENLNLLKGKTIPHGTLFTVMSNSGLFKGTLDEFTTKSPAYAKGRQYASLLGYKKKGSVIHERENK